MHSTFSTSRIFNDQDGWYIVMRESDHKYLIGSKHKRVGEQHLMGPFTNKHQVEDWFEGYLAMHAENRNSDAFIPDTLNTQH